MGWEIRAQHGDGSTGDSLAQAFGAALQAYSVRSPATLGSLALYGFLLELYSEAKGATGAAAELWSGLLLLVSI